MQTLEGLKVLLHESHSEEYAKKPGMVYQVWEDGEITLQKSGSLLNQRSLHCIEGGLPNRLPLTIMPIQETEHGFAYVENKEIADSIRQEIKDYFNIQYEQKASTSNH